MDGELIPQSAQVRMSDADRERVAERLQAAVGEGLLTLEEFEQRLTGVLAARTFGEVEPFLADLPGVVLSTPALALAELRTTAAPLKRSGQWIVARRLVVSAKAGSVKLDFTDAVIPHPIVEIELNVVAGSTTLVLPVGASVDVDNVEFVAGSSRVRGVPARATALLGVHFSQGPHFVVRGKQRAGQLVVRRQRRFWRWRW